MSDNMKNCRICPRNCGADRTSATGFCGVGEKIKVARAMLHMWEEPVISGTNGSGAVFFSGCNLKCCFCQNGKISSECVGKELSILELSDLFLKLQDMGAENINLVTGAQFVPQIIEALDIAKPKLEIPVVYNSSGYEKVETLKLLKGYIDIYLPDFKFVSSELSQKYCNAPNYAEVVIKALKEMKVQVGENVFDDKGMLKKGVIIRHLIMPMCSDDSIKVINSIHELFPQNDVMVSIMSQYTPQGTNNYKELHRRIYSIEYGKVMKEVMKLGINGFTQERSSAKKEFTPGFANDNILF